MIDPFSTLESASQALRITAMEDENRRLRELCRELAGVLDCMVDTEACRFDHHGMCQEHFMTTDNGECANEVAKKILDHYRKEMK